MKNRPHQFKQIINNMVTSDDTILLAKMVSANNNLKSEKTVYGIIKVAFRTAIALLTLIRYLFTGTMVISLILQNPNITENVTNGSAATGILIYFLLDCIPLLGQLIDVLTPVAVAILTVVMGNGLVENLITYILPICAAYLIVSIFISILNFLLNSVMIFACPRTYKYLSELSLSTRLQKQSTEQEKS